MLARLPPIPVVLNSSSWFRVYSTQSFSSLCLQTTICSQPGLLPRWISPGYSGDGIKNMLCTHRRVWTFPEIKGLYKSGSPRAPLRCDRASSAELPHCMGSTPRFTCPVHLPSASPIPKSRQTRIWHMSVADRTRVDDSPFLSDPHAASQSSTPVSFLYTSLQRHSHP